jgi:hypothetical protein
MQKEYVTVATDFHVCLWLIDNSPDDAPSWFHGDISKETAEDLLAGQPKGSYLVR